MTAATREVLGRVVQRSLVALVLLLALVLVGAWLTGRAAGAPGAPSDTAAPPSAAIVRH